MRNAQPGSFETECRFITIVELILAAFSNYEKGPANCAGPLSIYVVATYLHFNSSEELDIYTVYLNGICLLLITLDERY